MHKSTFYPFIDLKKKHDCINKNIHVLGQN